MTYADALAEQEAARKLDRLITSTGFDTLELMVKNEQAEAEIKKLAHLREQLARDPEKRG